MKRFTFLFLFAVLGFAATNVTAQSCFSEVNVNIASDCTWSLTAAEITGNTATADSVYVYAHDPKNSASGGGSIATSSSATFSGTQWVPGKYIFEIYNSGDTMLCWGHLNLEHKATPGVFTSRDTTDCIWYEKGVGYPSRNYGAILGSGCYADAVSGVNYSETTLTSNDELCDTLIYVRTGTMDFKVEKTTRTVVVSRDTLVVTPLSTDSICYPPRWVDVECNILPTDYDYDVNDADDHSAISALLSPANLKAYFGNPKKAGAAYTEAPDTMAGPYTKKDTEIYYDSIYVCLEEAKQETGETERVKVLTESGEWIWTQVKKFDYQCVRDTVYRVKHGTRKCSDYAAPKRLTDKERDDANIDLDGSDGPNEDHAMVLVDGLLCYIDEKVDTVAGIEYELMKKGRLCNITTKCVDWVIEGDCKNLPVVMRNWEIIDWCNDHSIIDTVQWIRVNDETAPKWSSSFLSTLGVPRTAEIEPWTCAAEYSFNPPATDWDKAFTVEYRLTDANGNPVGYVVMGDDGRTATFKGLLKEACPITVTATARDWCGNVASPISFIINLEDNVAPTVVAHDEINVTLSGNTGSAAGDVGVAKAYVDAFDNGSHDGGCGKVTKCVLLKEELDNPVYITRGNWYSKRADGKDAKYVDPSEYPGGYFTGGYVPAQCGDPDDVVYEWTRDKFGKFERIATHYLIYCKEYVKFCCDDLYAATGEFEQVALVVSDAASTTCVSSKDNVAYGWTNVRVEDKSAPGWQCIPKSLKCTEVENFVAPTPFYGGLYCAAFDVESVKEWYDETCGEGTYYVEWVAKRKSDGEEVDRTICEYPITGGAEFDPYTIKWPKHYDGGTYAGVNLECRKDQDGKDYIWSRNKTVSMGDPFECSAGDVMDAPVWCSEDCALIVATHKDLPIPGEAACGKIVRRWTVVDWCTWKPNGDSQNGDVDNDTHEEDFVAYEDWTKGEACEDCEYNGDYDNVYFKYAEGKADIDGYYTFDQVIKTLDRTAPIVTVEDASFDITGGNDVKDGTDFSGCVADVTVSVAVVDSCGDLATEAGVTTKWKLKGYTASGFGTTAALGYLSAGTYVVEWIAQDACGNATERDQKITVADNKPPTPVCLKDISTATMNVSGSTVAIWASDFELGSFDNCTEYDDLDFYFKDADGNEVTSLSFGCEDITDGVSETFELAMYVADASGNEDFCMVTLRVDDNNDICDNTDPIGAAIRGEVRTSIGDMIESAEVALNKTNTDMTGVTGKYAFSVDANNSYELTSTKSDDYLNGVSTLDLVLIQKHLLGITALNDAYKVIAADINGDGQVSSKDLVELRKLILGVYTELPNNASWRFVDAGQTFADANNPFPFAEAVTLRVAGDAVSQDFIGTKIGDVSGNAIANSLIAAGTRSAGTLALEMSDVTYAAGEEFSVAVSAANFSDIAALQFTMDVAGLELVGVESGALAVSADNFAQLDATTITTAWSNTAGVTADEALFTVTFRAADAGQLSSALAVTSGVTSAEAYTASADKLDVAVAFNSAAGEFALMQNEPNPFSETTSIAFQLAEAGTATLTVFDVTGKTISVVRGEYAKGMNQITLAKSDLGASGVLYYQLESGAYTATKKMVIIE